MQPLFVYDADCGFCTRSAAVLERLSRGRFDVVAWQDLDLAAVGLSVEECFAAAQFVRSATEHSAGHVAIADALRAAGLPWSLAGAVITAPGVSGLSARVYAWIADHRYAMPGGTAACQLPPSGA